jgi:DeoR/GlpR family transcriptional regulator of sugar metabolism
VEVALCGGRYHGDFNSCTGPEVTRVLSRIRAEQVLLLVDHSKFGA